MNWLKSFWEALTLASSGVGQSSSDPASNLTPRAQEALALARKEAGCFNHNFVGTEHLLLGLIRLGQGTAVTVLRKMGFDLEIVRAEVEKLVGTGPDQKMIGTIPLTPRVKKVLALAAKEAKTLNRANVGTEHILLGLLREGDGVAARVLKNMDVDIEQTREAILREIDPHYPGTATDAKSTDQPHNAGLPKPQPGSVDTRKRYDVYCRENNHNVVVYRNALFKGRSKLLSTRQPDFGTEFLELEQSNGQTVYLSLHSVVKFCEHGAEIVGELIPPR